MRFDAIDTFDPYREAIGPVVRPRRWPSVLATVGPVLAAVGIVVFVRDKVFLCAGLPLLALFALCFFTMFRRLCAPRAWLLAVDAQGISVMLRSPYRAPVDPHEATVVTLPWRDVAWVGPVRERRVTRGLSKQGEQRVETTRYLDVAVRDVDVTLLARKVDEAFETSSTWKNAHRQSQLVDGDVLRLEFSGPSVSNAPSLKKVLATLEGRTTVREERRIG